ncbi:chaperone [Perilla frutescens var. hirtella]|nr:chaperone [Perilla frutescens var. hirtella]
MRRSSISAFSLNMLIPLTSRPKHHYPSKFTISRPSSPAKIRCSQNERQLNLSVLRFTLGGIPGLDESYLPRYIGDISSHLKEDLAWGTYVLLHNTNSISVLISVEDALCVHGYWNTPKDLSKESIPDWFQNQTQKVGFSKLKDAMYLQQSAGNFLKGGVSSRLRVAE